MPNKRKLCLCPRNSKRSNFDKPVIDGVMTPFSIVQAAIIEQFAANATEYDRIPICGPLNNGYLNGC